MEEKGHRPLTRQKYIDLFCSNKSILIEAYTRAWETRIFEIDKFWIRTAFFWGFIILTFGGYIQIMTSERNQKLLDINMDIYVILLGIIFSVAWLLVIKGSKCWQENWEAHIDMLEDKITGPLYKIIYCSKNKYYSVSKINKILSKAVIGVWLLLWFSTVKFTLSEANERITIATVLTFSCIIYIC